MLTPPTAEVELVQTAHQFKSANHVLKKSVLIVTKLCTAITLIHDADTALNA